MNKYWSQLRSFSFFKTSCQRDDDTKIVAIRSTLNTSSFLLDSFQTTPPRLSNLSKRKKLVITDRLYFKVIKTIVLIQRKKVGGSIENAIILTPLWNLFPLNIDLYGLFEMTLWQWLFLKHCFHLCRKQSLVWRIQQRLGVNKLNWDWHFPKIRWSNAFKMNEENRLKNLWTSVMWEITMVLLRKDNTKFRTHFPKTPAFCLCRRGQFAY